MEAIGQNPPDKKGFKLLPSSSNAIGRKTRMGFNLIEAAIVLAVVGGVIGAIWVSAAKFYEDYKVNKTVDDLALIVKNIQGLISIRDADSLGNFYDLTNTIRDAGVFPKDWVDSNTVKNRFGGNVKIENTINPSRFSIKLYGIPNSACIRLILKISTIGANAGSRGGMPQPWGYYLLGNISIYNSGTMLFSLDSGAFPVTLSQAETMCSVSRTLVMFTYGYTRNN